MDYMDFGEVVNKKRKRNKYTQAQLAKKSGLSENTIRSIEKGQTAPTIHNCSLLAKAFGITTKRMLEEAKILELTRDDNLSENDSVRFFNAIHPFFKLCDIEFGELSDREKFVVANLIIHNTKLISFIFSREVPTEQK